MKLYIYLISLCLIFASCHDKDHQVETIQEVQESNKPAPVSNDSNMLRGVSDAKTDISKANTKYYYCGIAQINNNLAKDIEVNYNVKIVNSNCVIGNYELGYNKTIDSTVKKYYGVTVEELIAQQ